jgi:NAD-dependent SIR2 family protein deacetylase
MGALVRCDPCGAVMWDPLHRHDATEPNRCPTCGAEMKPERRRPGKKTAHPAAERRELAVTGPPVETLS